MDPQYQRWLSVNRADTAERARNHSETARISTVPQSRQELSAVDDLSAILLDAPCRIACVNHEPGAAHDAVIVVTRVVGRDQDAVVAGQAFRGRFHRSHV